MIFVKKDIFEENGKIFVESFALLVAMMLLLLGIADARALHFVCTIATMCIVAVCFSFFFNRIICCRQLREKENCFNDTLSGSCKAVFASFENKKILSADGKLFQETAKPKFFNIPYKLGDRGNISGGDTGLAE